MLSLLGDPAFLFLSLMNLLSAHDEARSLHVLNWRDDTADEAAIQRAKQRLKLATFFQMTFPGALAIYCATRSV